MQEKITLRLGLLSVLVLLLGPVYAQFGISTAWRMTQSETLDYEGNSASYGDGLSLAADYWFRLKNKRIEFLPTVYYGQYSTSGVGQGPTDGPVSYSTDLKEAGFQFRTNFYIFDFGTDCDCPTWGKQGPALHKGLFIQLAPGYSYLWGNGTGRDEIFPQSDLSHEPSLSVFSLGIGAGVDFGISNLLTITPQVSYQHYFGDHQWDDAPGYAPYINPFGGETASALSNISLGLRLGIRLDEKRY